MQPNDYLTIAFAVGISVLLIVFFFMHRSRAIEWLIWAVSAAEKEIGSKTGQLKLHRVYDWYIKQFPWISNIIPFCVFSRWVDIALKTMREWVDKKTPIGAYITGTTPEKEGENDENNSEKQS